MTREEARQIADWMAYPTSTPMPEALAKRLKAEGIDEATFRVFVDQGGRSAQLFSSFDERMSGQGSEAAQKLIDFYLTINNELNENEGTEAGLKGESADEAEQQRLEEMRLKYIEEGTSAENIRIRKDNDDVYRLYFVSDTGAWQQLDDEKVDTTNLGPEQMLNDVSGNFVPLPPSNLGELDNTPYLVGPEYQLTIDVDDYFAMLRWLDPEVKERVDDRQRVRQIMGAYGPEEGPYAREGTAATERGQRLNERRDRGPIEMRPENVNVMGKYAQGDEVKLFYGKSPEYIASIQQLMIEGGALNKSDVQKMGYWGMGEEVAMQPLLRAADMRGLSIRQYLEDLAANPLPSPKPAGFTQPVYAAPDMATLSQDLKTTFRNRLGREPEPYEMGDLLRQMEADYYADYQQQAEGARMEWEARQKAAETGMDQTTGTIQQVDPFARFKESFDRRYAPEMERQEETADVQANVGSLMNRLAGIEQIVGGM